MNTHYYQAPPPQGAAKISGQLLAGLATARRFVQMIGTPLCGVAVEYMVDALEVFGVAFAVLG